MGKKIVNLENYLYNHISLSENGCWIYTGSIDPNGGYGRIKYKGKRLATHRLSLALSQGKSIDDIREVVMHSCDTPACVNPGHLREGTVSENVADCFYKKRGNNPAFGANTAGDNSPTAKLSSDDVQDIRRLLDLGLNNTEIGIIFGVHHSCVSSIKRGKTWRLI